MSTRSTDVTDVTEDVCPLGFPPAVYGSTPAEIEATVQDVIERLFVDADGVLLSSINARTGKPYTIDDVTDRRDGVGAFTERSAIPQRAKAVWMNYENTGQACGVYLEALCAKACATGSDAPARLAARTVAGIALLWENAANMAYPNGGAGRGWLPKPYLGLRDLEGMFECSADQYCDVTLGLHGYYEAMASEPEKRLIERIVCSFADWWIDHDFAGIYFGRPIWWKRLENHPMASAFFLYLNALAYAWNPCRRYRQAFEDWLERRRVLVEPGEAVWVCMNGVTLKVLERLIELRPEMADFWHHAASQQAARVAAAVTGPANLNVKYQTSGFAANYLSSAHRLMPDAGYDALVRRCLDGGARRDSYYHLRRGIPLASLSEPERGEDFLDALQSECHVHWLSAYWSSPYAWEKPKLSDHR